jgi:hypothetical protein
VIRLDPVTAMWMESHVQPADANDVLWHFARSSAEREPGSFRQALVELVAKADPVNRTRLAQAFPGVVYAVELIQGADEGVHLLRAKVADPSW